MKKILLCLGLVAIASSCSSDSDSPNYPPVVASDGVLVKEVIYTSVTDDYTETIEYTYSGNKLVKGVYDDGSEEIFTYEGDLITGLELFTDGEVVYRETYTYDGNGRLTEHFIDDEGFTETETFVYNADGTVTSSLDGGQRTLHFQNGQLIKIVNEGGEVYNYTYDGKKSAFRNVTGFAKIAHVYHGDHEFFDAQQNISTIYESTNDVDYTTNTMTYNANDYPNTVTSNAIFESVPSIATVQYNYY